MLVTPLDTDLFISKLCVKVKVKIVQSCATLCDPMDDTIHGILQARIPEWVAFPFSRGSSQPRKWTQVFHIAGRFFTSWATREAPYKPPCLPTWTLILLSSHLWLHLSFIFKTWNHFSGFGLWVQLKSASAMFCLFMISWNSNAEILTLEGNCTRRLGLWEVLTWMWKLIWVGLVPL